MQITGERRIAAPRARVWRALAGRTGAELLGTALEGTGLVGGGLPARDGAPPLVARQHIREPFTTLGWWIGAEVASSQFILIRLAEAGTDTQLSYEAVLDDQDPNPSPAAQQAAIDQALEAACRLAGGPAQIAAQIAAGSVAGALQAARERPGASASGGGAAAARTRKLQDLLNPSVIGGVLFLAVLMFMLGLI